MRNLMIIICFVFVLNLSATLVIIPIDYPTIQEGLDNVSEGDTILVFPGIYYENIDWPNMNGIKLIGSGQEDCIIDGNYLSNVIRFNFANEIIDSLTCISDFTIQNGFILDEGGGISCINASPTLKNLIITNNETDYVNNPEDYFVYDGGGIYFKNSNSILINSNIINNIASGSGGGIKCVNSNPSFNDLTIEDNYSMDSFGGGLSLAYSNPELIDVTIIGNEASISGGGISCYISSPSLTNVLIAEKNGT